MLHDALTEGNHHGTVVAKEAADGWRGALLLGPTGSGKSDLALRLIDRGWRLVADDRVELQAGPVARAPATLSGKLSITGLGIVEMPYLAESRVALVVQIEPRPPAFPMERRLQTICGTALSTIRIDAFWPSAPILVERALDAA